MTANLEALGALSGIEEHVEDYLNRLITGLEDRSVREYLKWSIKGHTAGSDSDALELAGQDGTWDDFTDLELAKIDLGLNFNSYWCDEDDIVTPELIEEYCSESLDNL